MNGFIVDDGLYAAVPFNKKLMIIFNGQQLDVVNTKLQAEKYIKNHRVDNPTGVSKFTK
jgi:hypothetical protein